jgi:type IV secretion system protein VirD4
MPALSLAAGLMAGYGLKLWPFLQDLSQLKTHYESSWETFIGNAGLHIFFGNTDTTTLKYISERLGKVRVKRSSHSGARANTLNDDSRISVSFSDDVTPLLSPDEVQRIFSRNKKTGGFMVALLPGTLPTWLRKIEWYSHEPLKAIVRDSNTHTEPTTQKNTSLWNRMTSR